MQLWRILLCRKQKPPTSNNVPTDANVKPSTNTNISTSNNANNNIRPSNISYNAVKNNTIPDAGQEYAKNLHNNITTDNVKPPTSGPYSNQENNNNQKKEGDINPNGSALTQ